MLNSKFDLYRTEWLDLVFDDRNKDYGAYDLRKHYAGTLATAMGITIFGAAVLLFGAGMLSKPKPAEVFRVIKDIPIRPMISVQPVEPPKPLTSRPASPPVNTVANPPMVVTHDPVTTEPPTIAELSQTAIGPETVKGPATSGNTPVSIGPVGPPAVSPPAGDVPVSTDGLEVMPEPFGGAAAWSKFLQKNIRYPGQAQENEKQGRVWLSFIIEKDGRLSNIVVERGIGFGLDEEAARVLKLAPAWKPGIQNGHAVRVKYTIPINFQLATE